MHRTTIIADGGTIESACKPSDVSPSFTLQQLILSFFPGLNGSLSSFALLFGVTAKSQNLHRVGAVIGSQSVSRFNPAAGVVEK